jgi:hypothetical protein
MHMLRALQIIMTNQFGKKQDSFRKKYSPEENVKNVYTQHLFYANLFHVFLF